MMDNMISYHSARLMEFSATAARFLVFLHRDVWKIAFYNDFFFTILFCYSECNIGRYCLTHFR